MPKDASVPGAVQDIITILGQIDEEGRARVLRAVTAFFRPSGANANDARDSEAGDGGASHGKFAPAVNVWLRRNAIGPEHLEQVFHIENGTVSIIADTVPGKSRKEQTVNCYVLEGARAFLESGTPKFSDNNADDLCERYGCRDKTNHATNRSSAGNKLSGSREAGWTLVAPGLVHAASLIKEIGGKPQAGT